MGLITLVNIAGSPKEPRTLSLPAAWEQSTCFCQTAGECPGSVLKRDEFLRSVTPFIHRGRVWVHLSQLETGRPHKGTRKGRVTRASGLMMTLPYFLRALLHHRALLFLPFCVWEGFEKAHFLKDTEHSDWVGVYLFMIPFEKTTLILLWIVLVIKENMLAFIDPSCDPARQFLRNSANVKQMKHVCLVSKWPTYKLT